MPVGAKDPALAVQPTKIGPVEAVRCASFPLTELKDGNELRFVFEREVCCGDVAASECVFPFSLAGVR